MDKQRGFGLYRKEIAIIATIIMVMGMVLNMSKINRKEVIAEENEGITRLEVYSAEDKYEYLSHETIPFYTGFTVSSGVSTLEGVVLEVIIPKEYVEEESINYSDIGTMESNGVKEDEDNWIVYYELKNLSGGMTVDIPINFYTKHGDTPIGYTYNIKARLIDSKGEIIGVAESPEYRSKLKKPEFHKKMERYHSVRDGTIRNVGLEDRDRKGYASSNLEDLSYIEYLGTTSELNEVFFKGARFFDEIEVIDYLPEQAVFVEEDNIGWEYDEETHTATTTMILNRPSYRIHTTRINLKFPGVKQGEEIINRMKMVGKVHNKQEYEEGYQEFEDTIMIRADLTPYGGDPEISKRASPSSITDTYLGRQRINRWLVSVTNTYPEGSGVNLENIVIEDKGLNEQLFEITGVSVYATNIVGEVQVRLVYNDGTEEIITKPAQDWADITYPIENPEELRDVYLKTEEGAYLLPSKFLQLQLHKRLKDPNNAITTRNTVSVRNEAHVTANYVGQEKWEGTAIGSFSARPAPDMVLSASKSLGARHKPDDIVHVNDEVTFDLKVIANHGMIGNTKVESGKVVDLLPRGVEYVKGSAKISYLYISIMTPEISAGALEPEVIHNYQGTGQTALVWDVKDIHIDKDSNLGNPRYPLLNIEYRVKTTINAKSGRLENKGYFSWSNQDEYSGHHTNAEKDKWDLNNNGSVEDMVVTDTASYLYVSPRELIVTKLTKGDKDSNYQIPPSVATMSKDGKVEYEFEIYNNTVAAIDTLTMLDVFPHHGDMTVGKGKEDEDGNRIGRGSTFELKLGDKITPPEGFTVYYTTDKVEGDMNKYVRNSTWVTELDDYTKATSFKLELDEGQVLKQGYKDTFKAGFIIPENTELNWEDKAVNSIGTSLNKNLDFFESNLATVRPNIYRVQGQLYKDNNENGYKDSEEYPVSGVEVKLLNANGEIVKDKDGKDVTTVTDSKGYYRIDTTEDGEYRIGVTPKGNERVTIIPEDLREELVPNHLKGDEEMVTDIFTLNHLNYNVIRNGGFISNEVNYIIEHVNQETGNIISESTEGVLDGYVASQYIAEPLEEVTSLGYTYTGNYSVNGATPVQGDSYTIDYGSSDGDVTVRFYYNWEDPSEVTKRVQTDDGGALLPVDSYTNGAIFTQRGINGNITETGIQVNSSAIIDEREAPIALIPRSININIQDSDKGILTSNERNLGNRTILLNNEFLENLQIKDRLGNSQDSNNYRHVRANITNFPTSNYTYLDMGYGVEGTEEVRNIAIGDSGATLDVDEDVNYLGRWNNINTNLSLWTPEGVLGISDTVTGVNNINNAYLVETVYNMDIYNILKHNYEPRIGSDGIEYYVYTGTELLRGNYQYDSEGNVTTTIRNQDTTLTQRSYLYVDDLKVGQYANAEGFNIENNKVAPIQNAIATEVFDDGGLTVNALDAVIIENSGINPIENEEEGYSQAEANGRTLINYYEELAYVSYHTPTEDVITQQAIPLGGSVHYINPYEFTEIPSYDSLTVNGEMGITTSDISENITRLQNTGDSMGELAYTKQHSGFYVSEVDELGVYEQTIPDATSQNKQLMEEVLGYGNELQNTVINVTDNYESYSNSLGGSRYLPVGGVNPTTPLSYRIPVTFAENLREFLTEDVMAVGSDTGYPVYSHGDIIEEVYRHNYEQDVGALPSDSDKLITTNKGSMYLMPLSNSGQTLDSEYQVRLFVNNIGVSQTSLVDDKIYTPEKYLYGRGNNTIYSGQRKEVEVGDSFTSDQMVTKDATPEDVIRRLGIRTANNKEINEKVLDDE